MEEQSAHQEPPVLARPAPPPPKRLPWAFIILGLLLLLLILPYIAEQVQFALSRGHARAEAEVARQQLAELPELHDGASTYRIIAKAVAPSVVGIQTVRFVARRGDEFSFLFRQPYRAEGLGSGVVVDTAGYIITNFHVINNATQVAVELSDGRTIRDVEVVGADPVTDLAVLRINGKGLVAAPWGNSDKLEVGDPVLAVGNPFGLSRTVTAGIVSAKGRRGIVENLTYQDFLQTDAAVNPGNSGGPLVNMRGELVGINTAIVGRSYEGISFAIPSNVAQEVYDRLKTTGKVVRGWLGVGMQPLDQRLAERLGLEDTNGALVVNVMPDSPAEKAGIEPGDVVTSFNGESISDPADLALAIARVKVNSRVKVTVIRDGQERELSVTLTERPREPVVE